MRLAFSLALFVLLTGCQHSSSSDPIAPTPDHARSSSAVAMLQAGETFAGTVSIAIAPDGTSAEVLGSEPRTGTTQPPQNISYDLDLDKFLSTTNFRVSRVSNVPFQSVDLTVQFTHPFRAPNFAGAPTAGNRADLGFTGRLLILADENHNELTFPDDGTFSWDDRFVLNPDGFVATGDLLRTAGLTNNLFPYFLLVDEALDNRVEVSNNDSMTGNYAAAGGGWQRANAGDPANEWTGYDYVHQGQVVERTIRLRWNDVRTSGFQFQMALLAKYTDPRGTADYTFRMPFEPVDVTKFAYRLPHAALDVSKGQWCGGMDIMGGGGLTTVKVQLRDWDTGAEEATGTLGNESNVSLVMPGTAEAPVVELLHPQVFPTGVPLDLVSGSGQPGSELAYAAELTNTSGIAGQDWMFLRATDPEVVDPEVGEYHKGVDPETLIADPARAIKARTYMPVRVKTEVGTSWYRSFAPGGQQTGGTVNVTQDDRILISVGHQTALNDVSPAPCADPAPYGGSYDGLITELNARGEYIRHWSFNTPLYELPGGSYGDASGNRYLTMTFSDPLQTDGPISVDLDPTSGVDMQTTQATALAVVKLDAAGNYVWGKLLDGAGWNGTFGWGPGVVAGRMVEAPNGSLYLTGTFRDRLDLDWGSGTYQVSSSSDAGLYLTSFEPDGTWNWGWGAGGDRGSLVQPPLFKPNGDVVAIGQYSSDLDIDPGPGETILPEGFNLGGFRVQFTSAGALINGRTWNTPTDTTPGNAEVQFAGQQSDGDEWIVGRFEFEIDFDPGPGTEIRNHPAGGDQVYMLRLATNGDYQSWGQLETSVETLQDFGIRGGAIDATDGLVIFNFIVDQSVDLDPGPGSTLVDGTVEDQVYWARYRADGTLDWHHAYRNNGFSSQLRLLNNRPLLYFSQIASVGQAVSPTVNISWYGNGAAFALLQEDGSW